MKFSVIICAVLFSITVKGQSVIGSSGNGGNSAVSYTIGEAITSGGSSSTTQITQGFQQPNLWGVKLEEQEFFELKAFPNPVASHLTLESTFAIEHPYRLTLYSADGKLILESALTENSMQLDFSGFAAGTYTLIVYDLEGKVASFRIIKTK